MKKLLINRSGHLDVRNALGGWSVIKEIIDLVFVFLGANKFYHSPVRDNPLLFAFWIFSIVKMGIDFPFCLGFIIGKWQHLQRKRRQRKAKRLQHKSE